MFFVAAVPSTLTADQPNGSLIPVPPMRSVPQPLDSPGRAKGKTAAARKLSWRPSQQVAPVETVEPQVSQLSQVTQANSVGALIAQSVSPRITRTSAAGAGRDSGISQAAFTQDATDFGAGGFTVPGGDGQLPPRLAAQPQADPFSDPFNDRHSSPPANTGRLIISPQNQESEMTLPESIPSPFPLSEDASAASNSLQPSTSPGMNSPSDQPLDLQPPSGFAPPPETQEEEPQAADANELDSGGLDSSGLEQYRRLSPPSTAPSTPPSSSGRVGQYETESCEELRTRIASRAIQNIVLDISPPFRPDILEQDLRDAKFQDFLEAQLPRKWRNVNGGVLAEGEFIGLEFEHAIIQPSVGPVRQIPLSRLSEPDLEYITEQWGLPRECQLPNIAFQPRQWLPTTMTWKASGLCHKPLYFEEVNLERYGHTAGPFAQPVLSTAHFFVNIAVLPYKMGIHPPNECQYALGYYRPGNCAPWIIPPVPISLRGALFQAGAIGTGIALIP